MKKLLTLTVMALSLALVPVAVGADSPGYPDPGLPVLLLDGGGDVIDSTVTGGDGGYVLDDFNGPDSGEMDRIVIVRPVEPDQGKEGHVDGVGGEAWYALDDGPHPLANVPVQLWVDLDGDGEAETLVAEEATNADGAYYLTGWALDERCGAMNVVIAIDTGGYEATKVGGTALWFGTSG